MRCLYCGKRLVLLKKLTDGDFCSLAHRRKYQDEQEQLVIARLAENDHRLRRDAIGLSGGTAVAVAMATDEPPVAHYWDEELASRDVRLVARTQVEPAKVAVAPLVPKSLLVIDSSSPVSQQELVEPPVARTVALTWQPRKTVDRSKEISPWEPLATRAYPLVSSWPSVQPVEAPNVTAAPSWVDQPPCIVVRRSLLTPFRPPNWIRRPKRFRLATTSSMPFSNRLERPEKPETAGQYPVIHDCGTYPARLVAAARVERGNSRPSLGAAALSDVATSPLPVPELVRVVAPIPAAEKAVPAAGPMAFPRRLTIWRAKTKSALVVREAFPRPGAVPIPAVRPADVQVAVRQHGITAPFWPALLPSRPQSRLTPKPAHLQNGRVQGRTGQDRRAVAQVGKPWESVAHLWRIAPADLKWLTLALPLILIFAVHSARNKNENHSDLPTAVPVASTPAPAPGTEQQPERPAVEEPAATPVTPVVAAAASTPAAVAPQTPAGTPVVNAATPPSGLRAVLGDRFDGVQKLIERKAAIEMSDDFRVGLTHWIGGKDWARTWAYDQAGSAVPGSLALFEPSLPLVDYRMEFLGKIDKRAINWVFRAQDANNYYAMKLIFTRPGPLPTAALVRYAVIDGKETQHYQLMVPMSLRPDMMVRIRTDVNGDSFTTSIQGQVVDHFSDDRLKTGGVGFFAQHGEQARLRWVEVSHQYDALGRFFALLAPYNPPKPGLGSR